MYRSSRITAPVITAVAGLALIAGCSADPAPTPEETGTPSSTSVGTPESTATASGTDPSASTASGSSAATITLSRGQEHKITEANTSVSITCSGGGDIDVETNGSTVRTTGQCEDIDIRGNNNSVSGEDAESLDIEGNNNSATLSNVPDIDVDGTANSVGVEETGDIDVEGENNTVTYTSGDPLIETEGTNSVSAG
ncbi:DUF3060 domain-containing protein [Arthrobacter sp. zg-Y859]|uniref:DUF3060 domain-containing protein n=1 Tax=Arthrobacter jinronghuae TaxID=2964609 RepID=A0ABT1NUR1_9MICC|nr:DUF3060 domain-containing protein [Arthrobacter jinronghuae]MCQ1951468.1 DUF3060 domain-containing protein [Arthrobacter jinronghuae]UWX78892.1 DUF3060 domain-containing protein [Arthrobacter jinronghuae]